MFLLHCTLPLAGSWPNLSVSPGDSERHWLAIHSAKSKAEWLTMTIFIFHPHTLRAPCWIWHLADSLWLLLHHLVPRTKQRYLLRLRSSSVSAATGLFGVILYVATCWSIQFTLSIYLQWLQQNPNLAPRLCSIARKFNRPATKWFGCKLQSIKKTDVPRNSSRLIEIHQTVWPRSLMAVAPLQRGQCDRVIRQMRDNDCQHPSWVAAANDALWCGGCYLRLLQIYFLWWRDQLQCSWVHMEASWHKPRKCGKKIWEANLHLCCVPSAITLLLQLHQWWRFHLWCNVTSVTFNPMPR